jgi:8-oxo-dGTP diphosphatase
MAVPLPGPSVPPAGEASHTALPYRISTLLYCFHTRGEVLLLERAQEPNLGLWSPCGGKLQMDRGESPYACACREAQEELGVNLSPADLHLTGLVSEHGYQGQAHWLMFLFEVRKRLRALPPPIREGRFAFFTREEAATLAVPQTDREQIWPLFWRHRGGFFAAHCHSHPERPNQWVIEESTAGATTSARVRRGEWATSKRSSRRLP